MAKPKQLKQDKTKQVDPKLGDVVVLKSGGPEMTVTNVDKELGLNCAWFDDADLKIATNFPKQSVDIIK